MNHKLLTALVLSALFGNPLTAQETAEYPTAILTVINDTVIASEAPGIVKRVDARPGQDLDRDSVVVVLNRKEYEADLKVANMNALIAKIEADNDVNLRFARKSLEVSDKQLSKSRQARREYAKAISETDIDRLQLEVEQSILSAEQAEMQADIATNRMELAKLNAEVANIKLENRSIRSPFAGRLEQVYVQPGQWVNAGQDIARIVDLKNLRVKGIFNANLVHRIAVGNDAKFRYKVGESSIHLTGKVVFVSSVIVEGKFQVWVDIDNSEQQYVPGFTGKMTVNLR